MCVYKPRSVFLMIKMKKKIEVQSLRDHAKKSLVIR
jgi:hypothetical protein